jgi:hypothetical protein|tara:strand:+ start:234 stop:695 length:462 start_codon:yes stop_codon:yes gene_type:complete
MLTKHSEVKQMHTDLKVSTIWYDDWNFEVVGHTTQKEYRREYTKALRKRKGYKELISRRAKCNTYNMTEQELDKLHEEKWCHICGITQTELNKKYGYKRTAQSKLNIDHCHTTGKVRHLLCNNCNSMLGKAKDNPEILLKAVKYLKHYNGGVK